MPRDQLFALIKSLTPHEKGYIKRMAFVHQQSGGNNYLRLFDAIDQQKTYDEAALRKKLGKDQLMTNFASSKNYLQNVILRHLEAYDSSPANNVRSLLNQYTVLQRKGLGSLGYKLLHRALQQCEKEELDVQKVEVLHLLLSHVIMHTNAHPAWPGGTDDLLRQIAETSTLCTEASLMRNEMEVLKKQTSGMMRARNAEEIERFRATVRQWQAYDPGRLKSFSTRYLYYQLLINYLYICGDVQEGLKYSGQLCDWLLSNWKYAATKSTAYITSFYNKAMYELLLCKPGVRASIEVLERLIEREGLGTPKSNALLQRLRVMEAWETGRYADVQQLAASFLDNLRGHTELVDRPAEEMLCLHISASAYFATGQLQQAAKQLRLLLRHPAVEKSVSLSAGARILLLIIEFERGDPLGIDSQWRSTYRFLQQKKQLHGVEKAILVFLRAASRKTKSGSLLRELEQLKHEAEAALVREGEDPMLRIFDFLTYLESKISGVPFEQARRAKIAARWAVQVPGQ